MRILNQILDKGDVMKPHKHAEVIKAWADGAKIQCRQAIGICEWTAWNDTPYPVWDATVYRVNPKEYPKTTLTHRQQVDIVRAATGSYYESYEALCNEAIKVFITSGEMAKYIEQENV